MASGSITPDRLIEYRQKGYALVRLMFNSQEIDLLGRSAKQDKVLDDHAFGRDDGRGNIVRLSLWNHPGDTIYGMFARCESIVERLEIAEERAHARLEAALV
jgi:ectoine hydroxylase